MPPNRIDKLNQIARLICDNADANHSLEALGHLAGMSPHHLQKQFKKHFGLSPKEFQTIARNRIFKAELKSTGNIIDAIFAAGFGSSSRLYEKGDALLGMSPKSYKSGAMGEEIYYAIRQTSLGPLLMAAASKGVCAVEFGANNDELVKSLSREFPNAKISRAKDNNELEAWIAALQNYIDAIGPKPNIPLDIRGTIFQEKVWRFLTSLKADETISYSDLAAKIGSPKSVRAAATACGKNRIGILIPCHQVLRMNGDLGGYRWGLERKAALLARTA